MTLYGSKSPLTSIGVWGSSFVSGIGLLEVLKYYQLLQEGLPPLIAAGATLVGGLTALWGRIRATKAIKKQG